jgi:hypothetical protein
MSRNTFRQHSIRTARVLWCGEPLPKARSGRYIDFVLQDPRLWRAREHGHKVWEGRSTLNGSSEAN